MYIQEMQNVQAITDRANGIIKQSSSSNQDSLHSLYTMLMGCRFTQYTILKFTLFQYIFNTDIYSFFQFSYFSEQEESLPFCIVWLKKVLESLMIGKISSGVPTLQGPILALVYL